MPPPYTISPRPSADANSSSDSSSSYTRMTSRHASFLLGGLQHIKEELKEKQVPFHILFPTYSCCVEQRTFNSSVSQDIAAFAKDHKACAVVTDFSPMRHIRSWTDDTSNNCQDFPFYQVDAHNVVPVWFASDKKEVGARTLRPRINKLLPDFLTTFPLFTGNQQYAADTLPDTDWELCEKFLLPDTNVKSVSWAKPGTKAGMDQFEFFCNNGLSKYSELRNDPTVANVSSSMSPWINYGHVSFQQLALNIRSLRKHNNGTASFLEEGIVRRELSDNFCFFCQDGYDNIESGAAGWAKESLTLHETDPREYIYCLEDFESGKTHDDLWNAAQLQVVETGKMHGFLRMYWAKKILEWTPNASTALQIGLFLNDKYALDGNDPNGFVGVGWSVMGVHDMGWKERSIFGKIRYMNYEGCKRKFKVASFVAKFPKAGQNARLAANKRKANAASSLFASSSSKKLAGDKRKA
eukprot:CAMPEP_0172422316 /NCGR_PEP_ID=MMETSP1064-20121228/8478_1 /TAXON_ID=202472 /ORGANISM="Aulacoseira subarctica , Strain CCAP 1002/5" /LENGTH=466 /DNA_ID=CAMNT_0013163123 /DNA_START=380 /DNA_END=1780 /DNA_ORIENTATION=-